MTAQIPETLILDGEAVAMTCCPGIPEDHPRIVARHGRGREHSGPEEAFIVTTACWRGYRGTWEITDGGLYLVGLVGRIRGGDPHRSRERVRGRRAIGRQPREAVRSSRSGPGQPPWR